MYFVLQLTLGLGV